MEVRKVGLYFFRAIPLVRAKQASAWRHVRLSNMPPYVLWPSKALVAYITKRTCVARGSSTLSLDGLKLDV